MRALKLLKKITTVDKLTGLILATSLILTSPVTFASETSSGGVRFRGVLEIDREEAYACKERLNLKIDDFAEACSAAGLRGGPESCKIKIAACEDFEDLDDEEKKESEYRHCFAATGETKTLQDRVERLEKKKDKAQENLEKSTDRIDELTKDYHATTDEINTLAQEQLQAKEEFDQLTAEISNERAEALNKTRNQIETIDIKIYETQDAITNLYLEQQAMWTQNKIACRAQANTAAQQVEQRAYALKRSGKTYLSINGMLAKSGRSVKDEAIEKHNRVMRICTSIKNPENTKDTTNFGDTFLLKRSQDKQKIVILEREIRRLGRRKKVATKFYQDTLDQLSRKEQNAFAAYFKQEAFLKNKGMQLRQKLTNIQYKIILEVQKQSQRENAVREIDSELRKAEAKLSTASINGSSSAKEEAFRKAEGMVSGLVEADAIDIQCGFEEAAIADTNARDENTGGDNLVVEIDTETGEVLEAEVAPSPEDASTSGSNGSTNTNPGATVNCVSDSNGGSGQRCDP